MRANRRRCGQFLWIPIWLLLPLSASAQIRVGTVIVLGCSRASVLMAADSRAVHSSGDADSDECKIVALGGKFLFAATGIAGYYSHTALIRNWGAVDEARAIFKVDPTRSLDTFTAYWAKAISDHFREQIRFDPKALADRVAIEGGNLMLGVFAGTGKRVGWI